MSAPRAKVYSNPEDGLSVRNAKYIKNCTELFLARREIDALRGFERFVNLEVLFLEGNRLHRLSNLASATASSRRRGGCFVRPLRFSLGAHCP